MKTKNLKLKQRTASGVRKFSASASIFALLYSPFSFAAKDNASWVDYGAQIMDTAVNTMQQSMQQTMASQQLGAQMASLQPKVIPSKYFPHCKISQAKSAFPEGICQGGISSPQELMATQQYKQIGQTYTGMYDQLLSPAQNSSFPVGLQCLENAKRGMVTSLKDRQNSLQALKDKIAKESQFFKEQNKKLLIDMEDTHKELFGGDSGDINARTKDFSDFFSPACQNIIGTDNLAGAAKAGLNGIKVGLSANSKKAGNFQTNRGQITSDVNKQIQKIKNQIQTQGIQQWRDDVSAGDNSINGADLARMGIAKPVVGIVSTEISRLNSKVKKIQGELRKIDPDYEIPPMDSNFSTDFAEFSNGAETFFKKKYINECVTLADRGVAISPDKILKSLRIGGSGNNSVALNNYKNALQNILNSDSFIEDKMIQIKQLDARYSRSDITISYKNSGAQTVKTTPYGLFRETVSLCENKFEQDDTFSTGKSGISQKKKIKRAKKYMNELKELESTFASTIGNQIFDAVMNCSGRSESTSTCSDPGVFEQSSDSFCVKHATSCSAKVQTCYKKATALVEDRKNKIKNQQATYNKNVAALIAREEAYLGQVKAQVIADADYLKKYFPGANFDYPEGLFIKMPETSESEFGVDLLGGGSLDFIKDLPEQIGKLKDTLEQQTEEITGVIDEYIGFQKSAMEGQKQKWQELVSNCSQVESGYRASVAEANAKQQQSQQEIMGEVGEFCQRFGQLGNSNPAAGCGEGSNSASSLYEDVAGVADYLSSDTEMAITDYNNLCAQSQSERENGTEDDDDDEDAKPKSSLASLCKSKDPKKKLLTNALKNLPEELTKHKKKIAKYLKSGNESGLPKAVKKSDYLENVLNPIASIIADDTYDKVSKEDFEEQAEEMINGSISDKDIKKRLASIKAVTCAGDKKDSCGTAKTAVAGAKDNSAKVEAINNFITNHGSSYKVGDSLEETDGANDKLKGQMDTIKDKFQSGDNFCVAHENQALLDALETCKDDKNSNCWKRKWRDNKKRETDVSSDIDRAIASLDNNTFDGDWQRIGERVADTQCQASSKTQRGMGDYLQQMQQLGGADFSGQLGFGK